MLLLTSNQTHTTSTLINYRIKSLKKYSILYVYSDYNSEEELWITRSLCLLEPPRAVPPLNMLDRSSFASTTHCLTRFIKYNNNNNCEKYFSVSKTIWFYEKHFIPGAAAPAPILLPRRQLLSRRHEEQWGSLRAAGDPPEDREAQLQGLSRQDLSGDLILFRRGKLSHT